MLNQVQHDESGLVISNGDDKNQTAGNDVFESPVIARNEAIQ